MPPNESPSFHEFGFHPERRRGSERRVNRDRRSGSTPSPGRERRSGEHRRRHPRRDTAPGHLRNALQMLLPLASAEQVGEEVKETVISSMRRVWLALLEIERPG